MKKKEIVRKARDFDIIIHNTQKKENNFYVIYYKENNSVISRFGIAVSKKNGNAVKRNKYRRQIRNIIDNNKNRFKKGLDYIIIMKRACINLDFNEKEQNLLSLL